MKALALIQVCVFMANWSFFFKTVHRIVLWNHEAAIMSEMDSSSFLWKLFLPSSSIHQLPTNPILFQMISCSISPVRVLSAFGCLICRINRVGSSEGRSDGDGQQQSPCLQTWQAWVMNMFSPAESERAGVCSHHCTPGAVWTHTHGQSDLMK